MTSKQATQKEQILLAAIQCISEYGYANITLRNIAKEADVALSQVHYYFDNKSNLMAQVVKYYAESYIEKINNNLQVGDTVAERMSLLLDTIVDIIEVESIFLKLFFDFLSLSIWDKQARIYLNELLEELGDIIVGNVYGEEIEQKEQRLMLAQRIVNVLLGNCIQYMISAREDKLMILKQNIEEIKYIKI